MESIEYEKRVIKKWKNYYGTIKMFILAKNKLNVYIYVKIL